MLLSCSGSNTAPTDIVSLRRLLEQEIAILALGINQENATLASQPVSTRFTMGGNIAVRYLDSGWSGAGVDAFRVFWGSSAGVFAIHANIEQTLVLLDVELQGDSLALATVESSFASVRIDKSPPQIVPPPIEPWRDLLVFQREGGAWRIVLWDEAPEPDPHDEGEGASV